MANSTRHVTGGKKQKAGRRQTRVAREHATAYKTKAQPTLTRAETRALAEFRVRLKEILPNGELKSLILYGSKARGGAHPGSDVDLLVVYDSARGEKKTAIWDASSAVETDTFERDGKTLLDIQPFVLTEAELKKDSALGMPLLQNVAREGIVLEGANIVPEKMDRKYWTSAHIEDAKQALRTARLALASGDVRRPIAMAYFIYEDAARAALIAKGIAPQSHEGTQMLFGQHFIKTGLVPKKFAAHFARMYKDRLDATYEKMKEYAPEDAERALARAQELLAVVENLLPTLLEEK